MKSVVVLAVIMLSLCSYRNVSAKPVTPPQPISQVLHCSDTFQAVRAVSRHAAKEDTEHEARLLPYPNIREGPQKVCCLHGNILGYYLHSILPLRQDMHQDLPKLREDLARVDRDLRKHCVIEEYDDHENSIAFKNDLMKMGTKGINKAIGEIDILFTSLTNFCVKV